MWQRKLYKNEKGGVIWGPLWPSALFCFLSYAVPKDFKIFTFFFLSRSLFLSLSLTVAIMPPLGTPVCGSFCWTKPICEVISSHPSNAGASVRIKDFDDKVSRTGASAHESSLRCLLSHAPSTRDLKGRREGFVGRMWRWRSGEPRSS